jgi:hypothetical protein
MIQYYRKRVRCWYSGNVGNEIIRLKARQQWSKILKAIISKRQTRQTLAHDISHLT